MKRFLVLTLFIASAWGEVWERPPYIPDENHLPPDTQKRRIQEQEEKPSERKNKVKEEKSDSKNRRRPVINKSRGG